jgi:hypothetical protein
MKQSMMHTMISVQQPFSLKIHDIWTPPLELYLPASEPVLHSSAYAKTVEKHWNHEEAGEGGGEVEENLGGKKGGERAAAANCWLPRACREVYSR